MVFGLFRSKHDALKEKIIFTQKNRIGSLEGELNELKQALRAREDETKGLRTNFDRSKDRLVEQIIELSDKFADINQRMLEMAHENAKLKYGSSQVLEDKSSRKNKKHKKR